VPGVPALLQPVAHALLQANEEINDVLEEFDEEVLWEQPAGVASVGFHLQHIVGVLDRLFTYAGANNLDERIQKSIEYLKQTNPSTLTEVRAVGRKQRSSSVLGLLFHAAEHTMRHSGQLHVTARMFYE
jgi:uncharacterized damage-inducible protein DinB